MAVIAGAKYDLFLSYSHLDNERAGGQARGGWVDVFHDKLLDFLQKRLGRRDVEVFFDRSHRSNVPLTRELVEAARGSALLLVVLSPSYLRSEWCARERNEFLSIARDLGNDRVFLATFLDVDRKLIPPEFADLTGLPFWVLDREIGVPRTLGERDPEEQGFISQLYKLRQEIALKLESLGAEQAASPTPPMATTRSVGAGGARVFLARASDDLEEREERLRSCLTQAGALVQPRRQFFQESAQSFEAAVRAELATSKLFVQLLSASRGPELPFGGPLRLPALLHSQAVKAGVKTLRWRDRALDVASIADGAQRALLEGAIACPFEEFERTVLEELRREPPPARQRAASVTVFVAREAADRALAEQVASALKASGVTCYLPLEVGSPEAIRKDLEATLTDADGVLVVYGAADPFWVREQLRFGNKVFTRRERRPTLGIYRGPPPEKSELNLVDPNLLLLDCSGGFHAEGLGPFLDRLQP